MAKIANTTPQPNYPDQIISNKPQPGAEHAVNAAPISADLRRMAGAGAQPNQDDFIQWLSGTYPDAYSADEARRLWRHEHVSALAWEAAKARYAAQPARECLQQSAQDATDRDTHFYLAGWNGAEREVEANAHFNAALQAAPPAPQGEKVYAALPKSAGDSVDFGNGNIDIDWGHPAPAGGTSLYTADQMRAFADATAALRALAAAPAQAVAVPAPGVALQGARAGRVYVAGPMTGLPEFNFPAFHAKAAELRASGWHVENPAEHGIVEGAGWADYLHYDIGRMATCCAIHLLPGWCQSRGAALEVHIASVLGMEFQYAEGAERYHAPAQEHTTQLAGQAGEQDEGLAQAIHERDTAEGWADGLAGLIGAYFGQDIGEHSSAHNPWQEAKDIIEEAEPYRSAAAAPAQAQEDARSVLDDPWKRRMLDGRALARDEMGCGEHPALPVLEEGMKPKQFFDALGIDLAGVMAEDQMDMDAYDAMVEAVDYNVWTPDAPTGDGWVLVAIFDTEDGPAAWWLREAAPKQPARRGRKDKRAEVLPSWWPEFIKSVAELPDRNSPEDEPDAMVATADELGTCAINAIDAARAAQGDRNA